MTTFEMCPYCDEIDEYEIPEGHLLVQCRHCGMHIELCSICEDMNCEECDLFKVGAAVIFNMASDDQDLEDWLCDDNNGTKHKITKVDKQAKLFWLENCPYAVSFYDNFIIESEVE